MDRFLRCLFLMYLCYAMFAGVISVNALPTPQETQNITTSSISNSPITFTGGHWFDKPNKIIFFIRTDDKLSDNVFPDAYLVIGNERVLMSSSINHVEGIGSYRTVSLPRNNRCREYHFETLQFGNAIRWPKNNDLPTVEGERCLMSSSEFLAWFTCVVDLLIAFAYYTIPLQLMYFMRKAPRLPFPWVFGLFCAFIILCGTTHIVGSWMAWYQTYVLSAIVKVICAIISLFTAGALTVIIPKAIELPLLTDQYRNEISERLMSERYLRDENQIMSNFRRVTHAIRTNLSKEVIYHNTASQICRILDADRCQIFTRRPRVEGWRCVQDFVNNSQISPVNINVINTQLNPESKAVIASTEVKTDENVILLDTNNNEFYNLYLEGTYENIDKVVLIPITISENENGIIVIQHWDPINKVECRSHEEWTKSTLMFLEDLAEQISIALAQATLIEQDKVRIHQLADQNEALILARKEASAIQAHREFLAVMSHEMRTPLYAIFALTSMLLEMPSISQQEMTEMRDMLEIIKKSGDMLIAIINNVLDFSKYEEEQLHLERVPFCVQEAVETSLDIVALQGQEATRPRINYVLDSSVPYNVVGDMTRFRQIIVNLLSNACKFTQSDGDVMITVASEVINDKKIRVKIDVTDTGIGISEEVLPKLFEKFSQADASITRRYGGTGLGLAIVRKLIKLMNGEIHVERNTSASSGTKMVFHVDLDVDHNSPVYPTLSPYIRQKNIYILEKHEGNKTGITQLLSRCGLQTSPKFFTSLKKIAEDDDFFNESMDALIIDLQLLVENHEVEFLKNGMKEKWLNVPVMILVSPAHQRSTKSLKIEGDNVTFSCLPVKFKPMLKFLEGENSEIVHAEEYYSSPESDIRLSQDNANISDEEIPLIDLEEKSRTYSKGQHKVSSNENPGHVQHKQNAVSKSLAATAKSSESENSSPIIGPQHIAKRTATLPASLETISNNAKRTLTSMTASFNTSSPSPLSSEGYDMNMSSSFGSVETDIPKLDVLVVEDNVINQLVTSRILGKLNQHCDIAGEGEAAIRKCKKKEYDVVFMDISMADMDGFQTTEHIRNISQDMKRPWIIALTANALWHDRLRCIESGMNDFVSKPARKEDIRDALMRFINQNTRDVNNSITQATAVTTTAANNNHQPKPSLSSSTTTSNQTQSVNGGGGNTI